LFEKLSSSLSEEQKDNKIRTLLQKLSRHKKIICQGKTSNAAWMLAPNKDEPK